MKSIKEKNIKWWIRIGSCSLLFIIIGIFAYTKMCFLAHGVEIKANISKLNEETNIYLVEGIAEKATKISMNGREIFINKNGYFRELIDPLPGYSVVTLDAKDKFGNETNKKFQLVEKEDAKSVAFEN